MIGSYANSAIRALKRDKFHAALNIVGLAVSLAAALLIGLYIQHELSYETFFTQPEKVYRSETIYLPPGQAPIVLTYSPYQMTRALNADYASQLTATHLNGKSAIITIGDKHLRQDVATGDEHFFDVLDFPAAFGDAAAAIKQPGYVILTKSEALQLFGVENAVGRDLRIDDTNFEVGAVLKDLPTNTDFDFSVLVNEDAKGFEIPSWRSDNWNSVTGMTYFRVKHSADASAIAADMRDFVKRRIAKQDGYIQFPIRPLRDSHLTAGRGFFPSNRNEIALGALTGTALLLILIAGFNYVNLATARAMLRRPEVGLRKILGGTTRQLVTQFMGETLVTTIIAFLCAMVLAAVALPIFSTVIGRHLSLASALTPAYLAFGAALFFFVSFAAGAYPALYLASSRPTDLIRKKKGGSGGRSLFRSIMVAVQFSLTVGLIVVAAVVFAQVNHLSNLDLGFRKDGMLVVSTYTSVGLDKRVATFRDELARSPYFTDATASSGTPDPSFEWNEQLITKPGDASTSKNANVLYVDEHFFDVYGVRPIAGRGFSADIGSDIAPNIQGGEASRRSAIVLSEAAVSYYGFSSPREALGKIIYSANSPERQELEIVGVVPDIQMRLGRQASKPLVYHYFPQLLSQVSARVQGGNVQAAVREAQQLWLRAFPGVPMDYTFIEDRVTDANADDARQSELFSFFTGLAIVVACLGLFGLASFVAARRTQEIAIRKVLGASTANVIRMLLWDFAKPVLLANVIAWPIAWVLMRNWLNGFPYRVELSPAFFIGASAAALLIALVTVFARTAKIARVRPAVALKYE
jgi:putative ABC transport system permease protein